LEFGGHYVSSLDIRDAKKCQANGNKGVHFDMTTMSFYFSVAKYVIRTQPAANSATAKEIAEPCHLSPKIIRVCAGGVG
jgi:hypothetical protein